MSGSPIQGLECSMDLDPLPFMLKRNTHVFYSNAHLMDEELQKFLIVMQQRRVNVDYLCGCIERIKA